MPLIGPVLGGLILTNFSTAGFTGSQASSLANAIGNGIVNEILKSNSYTGTAIGTGPGSGIGIGSVKGVVGPSVGSLIISFGQIQNLTGSQFPAFSNAIGNAFATHIKAGIVQSTSVPVGIGTGTGKILGIVGPAVASSILQMMTSFGLTGEKTSNIANAIGNAIASTMTAAQVTTTITGAVAGPPAGPAPATGIDQGRLF